MDILNKIFKIIWIFVGIAILLIILSGCSSKVETPVIDSPNETVKTETVIVENVDEEVRTFEASSEYWEELDYNSRTNVW